MRQLTPPGMVPNDVPDELDIERGYWHGYSTAERRAPRPDIDRPINIIPTMQREPVSDPPQTPLWVNTNCPPWVCPPTWSQPVELCYDQCIPTYEQAKNMFCYTVPADYFLVIRNIYWEALNAQQYDVFQFDFLVDGSTRISVEDMLIDPAAPNQANRYAMAGSVRPMPTHIVVDRNHTLCVRATLRGPINLAGLSPYFPGQPITTGNCQMKVCIQGWLANLREDVDGAPRPTDLGDAASITLEDDQSRGGYP